MMIDSTMKKSFKIKDIHCKFIECYLKTLWKIIFVPRLFFSNFFALETTARKIDTFITEILVELHETRYENPKDKNHVQIM